MNNPRIWWTIIHRNFQITFLYVSLPKYKGLFQLHIDKGHWLFLGGGGGGQIETIIYFLLCSPATQRVGVACLQAINSPKWWWRQSHKAHCTMPLLGILSNTVIYIFLFTLARLRLYWVWFNNIKDIMLDGLQFLTFLVIKLWLTNNFSHIKGLFFKMCDLQNVITKLLPLKEYFV